MTTTCQEIIPLWDSLPPLNKPGKQNIESWDGHNVHNVTIPALYHFKSAISPFNPRPAVIILPGGGYSRLAFNHEGVKVAEWFAGKGFEAFVLKYRLPDPETSYTPWLVPVLDAHQAMHLVRTNASIYGINPDQVGIIGFSAGGHLAATTTTLCHSPLLNTTGRLSISPGFTILVYPVVTMQNSCSHAGSRDKLLGCNPPAELIHLLSPENHLSALMPPTLLVHSFDDTSVLPENSLLLSAGMARAGVDVTMVMLPRGGHGYGFKEESPVSYWINYLDTWIETRIK